MCISKNELEAKVQELRSLKALKEETEQEIEKETTNQEHENL